MQELHCSLWDSLVLAHRLQSLWASVVVAQRISCPGAHGILVPQPGIESESPALQGGFFTRPPRKSQIDVLSLLILIIISQHFCLSHHHLCVFKIPIITFIIYYTIRKVYKCIYLVSRVCQLILWVSGKHPMDVT